MMLFAFDVIIQLEFFEQPVLDIDRGFGVSGTGMVQVDGFVESVENDPAVFASGHVLADFLAEIIAQFTFDIIGDGTEQFFAGKLVIVFVMVVGGHGFYSEVMRSA